MLLVHKGNRGSKLAGFYRRFQRSKQGPFSRKLLGVISRAIGTMSQQYQTRKKQRNVPFHVTAKMCSFRISESASRTQQQAGPPAAALFTANIRDKYRRRFVLANTSQQTKTLFDKAHVRCIMHDIGITSSFVW